MHKLVDCSVLRPRRQLDQIGPGNLSKCATLQAQVVGDRYRAIMSHSELHAAFRALRAVLRDTS